MFFIDANTGMCGDAWSGRDVECAAVRLHHGLPYVSVFMEFSIRFGGETHCVDVLDSKHDEVLKCRSRLDYLNAYLLILP